MNYKRQGLRALGLSILAALGLMAFMAPGAQAGAGEWLILTVNGLKKVKELNPQLETVTGKLEGTENLLQVLGLNIRLYCEEVNVTSAHIVPLGHAKASLLFSKCYLTDAAGNKNTTCSVDNSTINILGLLIKHPTVEGSERWVLFSPLTGLTFATVVFLDVAPEECSVTSCPITGHVVASISTASGAHGKELLISTKDMLTLFSDELKFCSQVAHLKADSLVSLNGGTHAGRLWGYHGL